MVMCMPVQRRPISKALQPEEGRDLEKIQGLMLMPHPNSSRLQGVYKRIGMFDSIPHPHLEHEKTTLGFGNEYCYSDDNEQLFADVPMGWTGMVLLN